MTIQEILAIKVNVVDEKACRKVSPARLKEYLTANNWKFVHSPNANLEVWSTDDDVEPINGIHYSNIVLPSQQDFDDYGYMVQSTLRCLAAQRRISQLAILVELLGGIHADLGKAFDERQEMPKHKQRFLSNVAQLELRSDAIHALERWRLTQALGILMSNASQQWISAGWFGEWAYVIADAFKKGDTGWIPHELRDAMKALHSILGHWADFDTLIEGHGSVYLPYVPDDIEMPAMDDGFSTHSDDTPKTPNFVYYLILDDEDDYDEENAQEMIEYMVDKDNKLIIEDTLGYEPKDMPRKHCEWVFTSQESVMQVAFGSEWGEIDLNEFENYVVATMPEFPDQYLVYIPKFDFRLYAKVL